MRNVTCNCAVALRYRWERWDLLGQCAFYVPYPQSREAHGAGKAALRVLLDAHVHANAPELRSPAGGADTGADAATRRQRQLARVRKNLQFYLDREA